MLFMSEIYTKLGRQQCLVIGSSFLQHVCGYLALDSVAGVVVVLEDGEQACFPKIVKQAAYTQKIRKIYFHHTGLPQFCPY